MTKIPISTINGHCFHSRHPLVWVLTVREWVTCILVLYIVLNSVVLYFVYVSPSLDGTSDLRIGADSFTYLWNAGIHRNALAARWGLSDGTTPVELISTGGSLIGPVVIGRLLRSNFLILCFNYILFFFAVRLFAKSVPLRAPLLMLLLLVNPAILVSLLTLNKEILVLVSLAMFCKYISSDGRSRLLLFGALLVALFARWQQFLIIIVYLMLVGGLNPLRQRRKMTICLLVLFITISAPFLLSTIYVLDSADILERLGSSDSLQSQFAVMLTNAQDHYLYFAVVLPKIAINLYSGAFHFERTAEGLLSKEIYSLFIAPLSSLCNVVVTIWFIVTRRFRLNNDRLFFAVIYALIFAILPYEHGRYFLPVYVLLCVEITTRAKPEGKVVLHGSAASSLALS